MKNELTEQRCRFLRITIVARIAALVFVILCLNELYNTLQEIPDYSKHERCKEPDDIINKLPGKPFERGGKIWLAGSDLGIIDAVLCHNKQSIDRIGYSDYFDPFRDLIDATGNCTVSIFKKVLDAFAKDEISIYHIFKSLGMSSPKVAVACQYNIVEKNKYTPYYICRAESNCIMYSEFISNSVSLGDLTEEIPYDFWRDNSTFVMELFHNVTKAIGVNIPSLQKILLFDLIYNNQDRHGGNLLIRDDGMAIPIDHDRKLDISEVPSFLPMRSLYNEQPIEKSVIQSFLSYNLAVNELIDFGWSFKEATLFDYYMSKFKDWLVCRSDEAQLTLKNAISYKMGL